jgi:Cu-Zn family superoxide dismutase
MKNILVISVFVLFGLLIIGLTVNQIPDETELIVVEMAGLESEGFGTIQLSETKAGVLLSLNLENLPEGERGFHIHETGLCDGDKSFSSAGGHFNPGGHAHGMKSPEGAHAGDMPNIVIDTNGTLTAQILNRDVSLQQEGGMPEGRASLYDADGSSLIIHADADDHVSQPSGNAGPRIACGVIAPPQG